LQGAGHRGLGGPQDLSGLSGGEAQHVAQQQHGALTRRQQLDDGQEGQLDTLANLVARGRIAGPRKLTQPVIGVGCQRSDLDVGRVWWRGRRAEGRGGRGGGTGAGGQAPVGGDPVEPSPYRAAPVEATQMTPGAYQDLLQDVLGIVYRPEHPVAVHVQLTQVGDDQDAERALITRPRLGQ
jgi:hypothetical protein